MGDESQRTPYHDQFENLDYDKRWSAYMSPDKREALILALEAFWKSEGRSLRLASKKAGSLSSAAG
jgi:hypothetical protein